VYFDTHAHLDQPDFDADRGEVISRARDAGVATILCPAVSAESSRAVVSLAERYGLLAAVGIHPNSTHEAAPGDWEQVAAMVDLPASRHWAKPGSTAIAIFAPIALQQEYLDRHLRLSQTCGLPVILHCRDAQDDLLASLRGGRRAGPIRGVVHAFSGDAAFAAECLALGLYVSFAGNVNLLGTRRSSRCVPPPAPFPADRVADRDRQPLSRSADIPRQAETERAGRTSSTRRRS